MTMPSTAREIFFFALMFLAVSLIVGFGLYFLGVQL